MNLSIVQISNTFSLDYEDTEEVGLLCWAVFNGGFCCVSGHTAALRCFKQIVVARPSWRKHPWSWLAGACSASCGMCFFFVLNEAHPVTLPLTQCFCPAGRNPRQPHWCPCVPDRAAALRHLWNILPQTTEAEGQCTNVSQSFARKPSQKPLDWINHWTITPVLFGSSPCNLLAFGRWTRTSAMPWQLEEFDAVLTQHISQKLSLWGNLCVF